MPVSLRPDLIRRHAPRVVLVLVCVAIVLVGGRLALGNGSPEDEAVPWISEPAARQTGWVSTKPTPRPKEVPCRAEDIEVLWPEGGATFADNVGGSDATGVAVLVRNVGAVTCTLGDDPQVQGINREGHPEGPPAEKGTYLPSYGKREGHATIEPGEPARFYLSMSSAAGCIGPKRTYSGADVLLDNGLHFSTNNAWLQGTCPLKVSAWEPISEGAERFWALEARLLTPPSAQAGGELPYILELVNVTNATISLNPCPSYTQLISPEDEFDWEKISEEIDIKVHSTHRLNCASDAIGPQAVIRYQMKMPIPQGFQEGMTTLYWKVEGFTRPTVTAMFIVEGPNSTKPA